MPDLSPEHQRLIERASLAVTWAPHREGPGGWKDGNAALDALALKLARLEKLEAGIEKMRVEAGYEVEGEEGHEFRVFVRQMTRALLAAREEEAT